MNRISNIVIIGTNHHNTLSMVRSFGEEGRKVVLYIYGAQESFIASSIYVECVSYFLTASEAIDSVVSLAMNEGFKPIVIACSDEVSSLTDIRYDELTTKCYFFNAGVSGQITSFMDKQKQLEMAKRCGFRVPVSIDILSNDVDITTINYPCFVKPKASIHGGKNIAICHNSEELKAYLKKYMPQYSVLVQDYIRKEYEIVILGLSKDDDMIIPGFIQKHREERGGTTYCVVRPISELDKRIVESCKELINKINYKGLWGIECIKQGDDYFFLELNMRNDATTYAMKVAGVNLPYLFLQMVEQPDMKYEVNVVHTINSMVEFNDFNFVLKGKVGLFKWLKEYNSSDCKYFYSSDDPMPYKLKKKEYITFLRKRIFKF